MTKQSSGKCQTTPHQPVAPRDQRVLAGSSDTLEEGLANGDATIERALGIARDAHHAKTMRDLRARLDDTMEREGALVLTRDSALALLRAISEGLKPSMDLFVGPAGEDVLLVKNHPALNLLDELIDALADLDNGKPHRALKPASYAANASLSASQRKWDDELLIAVEESKRARGLKTRKEAEQFLADRLNASKYTRRGKPYSAESLKTLRDSRTKRKSPLNRQK